MVPTAIPALAPVESSEEEEEDEDEESLAPVDVAVGELPAVVVELPESNSEAVTLKHGTERSKSASSTNVCIDTR